MEIKEIKTGRVIKCDDCIGNVLFVIKNNTVGHMPGLETSYHHFIENGAPEDYINHAENGLVGEGDRLETMYLFVINGKQKWLSGKEYEIIPIIKRRD